MNQCEQMLDMMQRNGSVTGMDCINAGIMNYKGRASDLRKLGFDVRTRMETKVNSKGEKKTYARYYLA